MSKLSHYFKLRSSISGCNVKEFECDKYIDCDSCLEDKIKAHDSELLDKVADKIKAKYPLYFNEFGMIINKTLHKDIDEVITELKSEVNE